ncbi:MAG: recombination protein RecR [Clostridia bacterium]|nr:recombination protein RecR [Clostridia bacterium]
MSEFIAPLESLIEGFARLPGVGRKSATRYALAVLDMNDEDVMSFADSLAGAKTRIKRCKICGNFTDTDTCPVCDDTGRAPIICVVEDVRALMSIERVREYRGRYHVLGGVLSPMNNIGPDQLNIASLLSRISAEGVTEVIIATNPTVEGEATAMYLTKLLTPLGVKTSRLAYGIPVGADLEYTDAVTLMRALDGRRELN